MKFPLLAIAIHFVVNECQPLILFYLGFRTAVKDVAMADYTDFSHMYVTKVGDTFWQLQQVPAPPEHNIMLNKTLVGKIARRFCGKAICTVPSFPLGHYMSCLKDGVSGALMSLDRNYVQPKSQCVSFNRRGSNFFGMMHLSCVVFCALYLLVVCTLLIAAVIEERRAGRKLTLRSGRYLRFSWRLETRPMYKVVVYILFAYAIAAIFVTMINGWLESYEQGKREAPAIAFGLYRHKDFRKSAKDSDFRTIIWLTAYIDAVYVYYMPFMIGALIPLFATVYGAFKMIKTHEPKFAYKSDEFLNIRFKYKLKDIFTVSNDSFAYLLEGALLEAKYGSLRSLENLLEDPSQAPAVVSMCDPRKAEGNDGGYVKF